MLSEAIDDAIRLGRQNEREQVMLWLCERCPDMELIVELPHWRGILWAIFHPVRFGVAAETAHIGMAVFRGEHIQNQSEGRG